MKYNNNAKHLLWSSPVADHVHLAQMEKLSLREAESKVNLLLQAQAKSRPEPLCPHDLCSFYCLIVLSVKAMGPILVMCLKIFSSHKTTFSSPALSKTRPKQTTEAKTRGPAFFGECLSSTPRGWSVLEA